MNIMDICGAYIMIYYPMDPLNPNCIYIQLQGFPVPLKQILGVMPRLELLGESNPSGKRCLSLRIITSNMLEWFFSGQSLVVKKKLFCWSWLLLHIWISMAKRLGDYINLNYPSKIGDEIVTDWRKKNIRGIGVAAFCSLFATGYLQNLLISLSYKHPRTEGKISKKQRTFL